MKKSCRGYSFFELVLAVAVLAVVAVLAMPSLSRSKEIYTLVAAANEIQSQLQSARIQAISRNLDHRLRVISSTAYVIERRVGLSWVVTQNFQMPKGLSIAAASTAEFHSRGNASPVTTLTITSPRSDTRQVAVEASGYIHGQ
jgi:prepilin-type N-terminal cleavage/methylation domain-containing protein